GWSSSSPGRAAARRLRASMKCASSRPRTSRFTHDSNADRAPSAPGGIGQRDFPRRRCSAPWRSRKMRRDFNDGGEDDRRTAQGASDLGSIGAEGRTLRRAAGHAGSRFPAPRPGPRATGGGAAGRSEGGNMNARSLPLSAQELCQSIRACTPFDASRLDRVLGVDQTRGLAEVQSGATWRSLAARLRPGDAQAGAVRTTHPTIGESLACNAAGPDGRPTVSHVESFTMVTPDGQLRRVNRISNPSLFSLVVGGQGLFGALYSVTLRLESLARALSEAQAPASLLQTPARTARKLVLLVPPEGLEALIAGCREQCGEWRIGLESLAVRRLRADQETFLRWAGREYCEVSLGLSEPANLGCEVRVTQLKRGLLD